MNKQFVRGQRVLSTIIGFHLLLGILSIASFQSFILPATLSMTYTIMDRAEGIDTQLLNEFKAFVESSTYAQAALAEQGKTIAFHIFWCIMLYLGFNWVRILLGFGWIMGGLGSMILAVVFFFLDLVSPYTVILVVTCFIYGIFGGILLFSPAVNTYMRAMRR